MKPVFEYPGAGRQPGGAGGVRRAGAAYAFICGIFFLSASPGAAAETTHVLRRGGLAATITVDGAEAARRFGPRFDRGGAVTSLVYSGVEYISAIGLADEFGIDGTGTPGFAEAGKEGGAFIKIGVGELSRYSENNYIFWVGYPVRSLFPVEVEAGADGAALTTTQVSPLVHGYAYRHRKSYTVAEGGVLTVTYELENTGEKPFTVSHYNHNWLRFADAEPDAGYRVQASFPWPGGLTAGLTLTDAGLGLADEAKGAYWAFDGEIAADANALVVRRGGLALGIEGDFPAVRFALWVGEGGFCPEVFGRHTVAPGETARWRRIYRILSKVPTGAEAGPVAGPDVDAALGGGASR